MVVNRSWGLGNRGDVVQADNLAISTYISPGILMHSVEVIVNNTAL